MRRFDNINDGGAYGTDEGVVQNNQWVHVKYVASCTGADDEDAKNMIAFAKTQKKYEYQSGKEVF